MKNGTPAKPADWDQYSEYEALDKVLLAQHPRSDAAGKPVHDEKLFIIFHQIYELWFKQILLELDEIQRRFAADVVDDRDMQPILLYLNRIVMIFRQLTSMMDVLETMPAQAFVDFRQYLGTASGFQSWQFRLIETRLGLRRADRIPVFSADFDEKLKEESRNQIRAAETAPSLFDQIDSWLSRTPFVAWGDYSFQSEYRAAVHKYLEAGHEKFDAIFDPAAHKKAQDSGTWRLSLKALQAALFITVYRTEPILQSPGQILTHIIDIDELLTRWRYRHALMVQRMVGMGAGTGGSSGYGYLMETLNRHRIFTDLFALSGYIIPSAALPDLPESIRGQMAYKYGTK